MHTLSKPGPSVSVKNLGQVKAWAADVAWQFIGIALRSRSAWSTPSPTTILASYIVSAIRKRSGDIAAASEGLLVAIKVVRLDEEHVLPRLWHVLYAADFVHELDMFHQISRCRRVVDVAIADHRHQIVGRILLVIGEFQINFRSDPRLTLVKRIGILMRRAHRNANLRIGVVEGLRRDLNAVGVPAVGLVAVEHRMDAGDPEFVIIEWRHREMAVDGLP